MTKQQFFVHTLAQGIRTHNHLCIFEHDRPPKVLLYKLGT